MIKRVEHKDGTVRWQVYGRAVHRDTRKSIKRFVGTYDSEREAKKADAKHRVTQDMIADGELPPEVDASRTFEQAADEWITSLRNAKARKAEGYAKRLEIYLKPALGSVPIMRMTSTHVMKLRDEHSQRFAPATVNGTLITLSSAFTYFTKRQWVTSNPCRGVDRVEDPQRAYRWIHTREEMTRLLLACSDELRDIVALALGTGMRFDELLHLQWVDVDLARRLISVHRGRQGTVKSGKLRHVPILDSVLPMLKARALKRGGAVLVFPGETGAVRGKSGVFTIYKLALKRAQLDTGLRFHDLRHTFASHWMMDGGCIFKLAKVLGHSSVAITQRTYAHLSPTAFEVDYGRVGFHVPTEPAKLYELKRDDAGKIVGRATVVLAAV